MKLEHSFDVEAPIATVWSTMIDIERVAPCLPGAEVTDAGDGVYEGTFVIKLGPTTASYAGKLALDEVDAAAHRVTMNASGRDKRGQGTAKATIESAMSEAGGTTHVEVTTDFTLTGKLARFGRGGMIEDVSSRLVDDFVGCLRSTIEQPAAGSGAGPAEAPPAAKPVRGLRLLLSVLWQRLKRLLRRGS